MSDATVVGPSAAGDRARRPVRRGLARARDLSPDAIRAVLGDRVLALEHIGSTSVPGLAAKPVLDLVLTVADPADEAAYVPALEPLGLLLHIREPDWDEHRMLTRPDRSVNLHVFGPARRSRAGWSPSATGCAPTRPTARPTALSRSRSPTRASNGIMDYNNHKAELVYDIYERALRRRPGARARPAAAPLTPVIIARSGSSPGRTSAGCGRRRSLLVGGQRGRGTLEGPGRRLAAQEGDVDLGDLAAAELQVADAAAVVRRRRRPRRGPGR